MIRLQERAEGANDREERSETVLTFESILCPVDFSEFSAKASDYAESLARHYGAKLYLEHVVGSPPPTSASMYYSPTNSQALLANAQKELQEFAKTHSHDAAELECVMHEGGVTDSILGMAEEKDVDLIVMGTHGRRGVDRLMMGSITEKVLRKAHCPVLAVRKPHHDFVAPGNRQEPVHVKKILFCTDFSENSDHALRYALSLATEYDAELTLLHVLEDLPASTDLQIATARVFDQLEQSIPSETREWCAIKAAVRIGRAYQEIIQLGLEAQTDLVILGVRGRSALDLALFGSTTYRVIQLGSCPVLSVHI